MIKWGMGMYCPACDALVIGCHRNQNAKNGKNVYIIISSEPILGCDFIGLFTILACTDCSSPELKTLGELIG